jgi:hypothetical protein
MNPNSVHPEDVQADPEAQLRALWTAQGVPVEKQDAILADVRAKAQPGARVGPFRLRP